MRVPDLSGLTMSPTPLRIGAAVDDEMLVRMFDSARETGDFQELFRVVHDLQRQFEECKEQLQKLEDSLTTPDNKGKRRKSASPRKDSPETPKCPPRAKCHWGDGKLDPANLEQLKDALQDDSGTGPATRSRAQEIRAAIVRAREGNDPGDGAGPSSSGAGGSDDPFKTPPPRSRQP